MPKPDEAPPAPNHIIPSERSENQDALATVLKILKKAEDALAPLEREMRLMGWQAEHRAIVWEAIIGRAEILKESCK